jgi:hypothetical protein
MRAQCVLVATTLLHSGAKFHSIRVRVNVNVRVTLKQATKAQRGSRVIALLFL